MQVIERYIASTAWLMAVIAGVAIFAIIGLIMADVVTRLFGISLVGVIELVRITFVVSVFFAFAHVILSEREIRVDALRFVLPRFALPYLDVAATIVTLLFFGFMFWFSAQHFVDAWSRGIFMDGELLLPIWLPWGTIVLGSLASVVAAICLSIRVLKRDPEAVDPTEISAATRQVV